MNSLVENQSVKELNVQELKDINGGGSWNWKEALAAYGILGIVGVGFYTLGTMQ